MNKPHKHAELIKQWADGAEIECYCRFTSRWFYKPNPNWSESLEYRVKPKVKWTPKYRLITACEDGICMNVAVPKAVCNYYIIQQFVSEHENDWDNQHYEVLKSNVGYHRHRNCVSWPLSVCAIRMSKECADKICEMLNNGEIEL